MPSRRPCKGVTVETQNMRIGSNSSFTVSLLDMLRVMETVLSRNGGVCMAPSPLFPSMEEPGSLTIQTDASGADDGDGGGGGFAYSPDCPNVVFIVHAPTREDITNALREGALPKGKKTKSAPSLSMPAYELFWSFAVAARIVKYGIPISSVTMITDCKPAAGAANAAASPIPQLNYLLKEMYDLCSAWLGVAIPRELNRDPDRLSHPSMCDAVRKEAIDAGWTVVDLVIDKEIFDIATNMAKLLPWDPDPNDERPWRTK